MRYIPPKNKVSQRRERDRTRKPVATAEPKRLETIADIIDKPEKKRPKLSKPTFKIKRKVTKKKQASTTAKLISRVLIYGLLCGGILVHGIYFWQWYESSTKKIQAAERNTTKPAITVAIGKTTLPALPNDYHAPSSVWVVVNKNRLINPPDYTPVQLAPIEIPLRKTLPREAARLQSPVASALRQLATTARNDGVNIAVNSAYRSLEDQRTVLNTSLAENTEGEKYTAPLSASEHQLGLAVDLSTVTDDCVNGNDCSLSEEDAAWLAKHAHEFGFILRYPEGQEAKTGYNFEPWHYRYVGKPLATALYENNLVLEDVIPALDAAREELIKRKDIR